MKTRFLVCFFFAFGIPGSLPGDEIVFNRDIRPILADKCFHCHGPDGAAREAQLRLDIESGALGKREGGPVIVPGKPGNSELVRRILHADPSEKMPPVDSKRVLSAKEIQLLTDWIRQGAHWQKHWSFVSPGKITPPRVESSWIRNDIDRFVWSRLKQENWKPSPAASRTTLIRRVSQDLVGLPPTLGEIDDFLNDVSPNAFEKVVDRLLESPHYGERMAQVWLDAARYADTHGYSLDRRRVMWPWRDWVIKAYNDNKPFNEFATEQLAGDLLPAATIQQKVATGFNRNHPIQSEGGVINEEYRIETVVDRVETTSAVFLGLTMGCGRCHDHKYEPISQKEFYQFFAFFNNVPESAHVGNADNQADRPLIKAPSIFASKQISELEKEIKTLQAKRSPSTDASQQRQERIWIDDGLPRGAQAFGNGGGPQEFLFVTPSENHPVLSGKKSSFRKSQGRGQHGFQGASDSLKIEPGTRLFAYVYLDPKNPPKEIMLQWNVGGSWEHRAFWGENLIPWGKDQSTSRKHFGKLPAAGKWVRLEVPAQEVGLVGKTVSGWAFTQFDGTLHWDKAGVNWKKLSPQEKKIQELQVRLKDLTESAPTVMIMSQMKPPRKTFVLNRGQYDAPTGQPVEAQVPSVLGKLESQNPNRLALARWMFSGDNPLTARVAVNRYWQMYFGQGLVETVEDFGTQGSPPTHPELLDWLALEFVRSGWDVKAMQKRIVMSATYQQSSAVTPEILSIDPANLMLARAPRFRLSAEAIRDQALSVSGLLVRTIGGKSVRPYQPPGLWKDVVYGNVPKFQQDHGDDLYRRSLYTYWKRSVPPPNMQALDAPSREACTLKRSRTNTPQGALVLWNDPTFVEAARILAEKIVRRKQDHGRSLQKMFKMVVSRLPTEREMKYLEKTHAYFVEHYTRNPASALDLLKTGEFPRDETLDPANVASLTTIANALFGLDEVLTRN